MQRVYTFTTHLIGDTLYAPEVSINEFLRKHKEIKVLQISTCQDTESNQPIITILCDVESEAEE